MSDATIQPRAYWCFISYRHTDNKQPGRQWATWLHHTLETYEIPADLIGKTNSRGETIPERIFPVFRDEVELAAEAELPTRIEKALSNSKCLVVICSPRSVLSRYVADEIIYFKSLRAENKGRVFTVIVGGDPTGEEVTDTNEVSPVPYLRRQCFSHALRYEVSVEGGNIPVKEMPLAADFRLPNGEEGYTSPAAYRESAKVAGVDFSLNDFASRLELMKLKIIASVLGLDLGELTKRDKAYQLERERHRARILRRWLALVVLLTVLAIISGAVAFHQREIARGKEREALKSLSRADFERGSDLIEKNQVAGGAATMARSLRNDPENLAAARRLYSLLAHRTHLLASARPVSAPGGCFQWEFSPDGKEFLLRSIKGGIEFIDAENGSKLRGPIKHEGVIDSVVYRNQEELVVMGGAFYREPDGYEITLQRWNSTTLEPAGPVIRTGLRSTNQKLVYDRVTDVAAIYKHNEAILRLWNIDTGLALGPPIQVKTPVSGVWLPPKGGIVIVAERNKAFTVFDIATGGKKHEGIELGEDQEIHDFAFTDTGAVLLQTGKNKNEEHMWQLTELTGGKQEGFFIDAHYQLMSGRLDEAGLTMICTGSDERVHRVSMRGHGAILSEPVSHRGVLFPAVRGDYRKILTSFPYDSAQLRTLAPSIPGGNILFQTRGCGKAVLSPDGKTLAALIWGFGVKLFDADTGVPTGETIMPGDQTIGEIVFSPDSQWVAVSEINGTVQIFRLGLSGEFTWTFDSDGKLPKPLFSLDGALVLVLTNNSVLTLWDRANRRVVARSEALGVIRGFGFLDRGRSFWCARDRTVELWNAASGRRDSQVSTAKGIDYASAVALSPDETTLAITSSESGTRLLRLSDCAVMRAPVPLQDSVQALHFSPDAEYLLVRMRTEVRILDANTGVEAAPPLRVPRLQDAMFTTDGKLVLTNASAKARLWDWRSGRPVTDDFPTSFPASLSVDGKRMLHSPNSVCQLTRLIPPESPPSWLAELAECVFEQRLNDDGTFEHVNGEAWLDLRSRLGDLKGADAWSRFGRWFSEDPWTRSLTPDSTISTVDYLEKQLPELQAIIEEAKK